MTDDDQYPAAPNAVDTFTLTIAGDYSTDPTPIREARVAIYATAAALNADAGERDGLVGGICHRWSTTDYAGTPVVRPEVGMIRLAYDHLGIGVVSHECAHLAVHVWNLDRPLGEVIDDDTDEPFAWLLGDLVRQVVNALRDRGHYTAAEAAA